MRPISILSAQVTTRFFMTAAILLPSLTLVAANFHPDSDRNTLMLAAALSAQDVKPMEPFRGVERGE